MSKKIIFSCFFLVVNLLFSMPIGANAQPNVTEKAEESFAKEDYDRALELFEQSYEAGYFTEKMLYRLAWLYEKNLNYPMAIYYLRKLNQEFGGKLVEDKIRYLAQASGGKSLYSAGAWDGFLRFMNRWAVPVWFLFILSVIALFMLIAMGKKIKERIRSNLIIAAILLFLPTAGILITANLVMPTRAVIVKPTSFFSEPGYAAFRKDGALSPGETVNIRSSNDIWVQVQAGEETWWVPQFVIKKL